MEEISFSGEKYIKASILAKNFGYTPDYIGQLCRGKQIKCTLIGRSWYVSEESLREHRKGRYRSSSAKSKEYLRKVVEEKSLGGSSFKPSSVVNYQIDEGELFPLIKKEEKEVVDEATTDYDNGVEVVRINKALSDTHELDGSNSVFRQSSFPRRPTPTLRTIPALRPIISPIQPNLSAQESKKGKLSSSVSPFLTFAVFISILMVESALLFGALGLEKRLVLADSNQAMVLYAFSPEKVVDLFKQAFVK